MLTQFALLCFALVGLVGCIRVVVPTRSSPSFARIRLAPQRHGASGGGSQLKTHSLLAACHLDQPQQLPPPLPPLQQSPVCPLAVLSAMVPCLRLLPLGTPMIVHQRQHAQEAVLAPWVAAAHRLPHRARHHPPLQLRLQRLLHQPQQCHKGPSPAAQHVAGLSSTTDGVVVVQPRGGG